jgi:hypothetical protein
MPDRFSRPVETTYQLRRDRFAAQEQAYAAAERRALRIRICMACLAAAMLAVGWLTHGGLGWYAVGAIAIGGFFAMSIWADVAAWQRHRHGVLRRINEHGLARLHRDWNELPEPRVEVPPQHRAMADDLDLFGHASLFQLLCVAQTPAGIVTLRDWLLKPSSPDEIQRRQEAVRELAPQVELRETFLLEGILLAASGKATQRLIHWAESAPWLAQRRWLVWLVRILPAIVLLAPALAAVGLLSFEGAGVVILAVLALNTLVIVVFGGRVNDLFSNLGLHHGQAAGYVRLFEIVDRLPIACDELQCLRNDIAGPHGGVLCRMRQLDWIARLANPRHSPLAKIPILILQFLLLYDFQLLSLLEAWQVRYGRLVGGWLATLGRFEALCCLATLAHDNPEWTMPTVGSGVEGFRALKLGHPLLPVEVRVDNEVEIRSGGEVLLVTGSNMSGKSTLLRAIGLAAVMAQAGAPVCSAQLVMPPLVLGTSTRNRDSLEDGVSLYMAELKRLKEIVELARIARSDSGRQLLFLFDEILLGTNSRDRHLATERVLAHLLHHDAIGAVSTHDLDLATSEALRDKCRPVHFRETLHDEQAEKPMTFDYQLRPGLAPTSNALKLLELVGLDGQNSPSN